jgi:molybdopterin synthase catalytic subunit
MRLEIALTVAPIERCRPLPLATWEGVGALAHFTGLVRGEEQGRPILALEYEAYASMAERVMAEILRELESGCPCRWVRVTHRLGWVPVGEAAIEVVVASAHRGEAFTMLSKFMDRLKQDVPIWKCGVCYAGES